MDKLLVHLQLLLMLVLLGCTAPLADQGPNRPAPTPSLTAISAPPVSTAQAFCATNTQITQTECQALVALYVSTAGAGWKEQTGWLTTAPPCTWYGITCVEGKIDKINLMDNGLRGMLPAAIGGLSSLRQLYLQHNQISGMLPADLGALTNLHVLLLSANQFSGSIPETLGNMQNLLVLYLDDNQFTGSIPASLGNLPRLRYLFLQTNQLRGPIPATFTKLTALQDLHLYANQLQGPIPENLDVLPELQHVKLEENDPSLCLPAKLQAWANSREIYNPPPGGVCQEGK